jgi:polygalacturonase
MYQSRHFVVLNLFALFIVSTAHSQDSRTVVEPHIPSACITLKAKIAVSRDAIPEDNELSLDTGRIQQAIDSCPEGKAVVLDRDGQKNAFLSGPLQLRSGVTLVIAAYTSLVGSRDPRLFDRVPGSCGMLSPRSKRSAGCNALISGDGIENSGVMGEGSIDGRGGAKLLGQQQTWWDLAYQGKVSNMPQSVFDLIAVHHARNFTLYGITLRNAPGTHVGVDESDGFTAWGVNIMTPKAARNTDGIDPGSTRNVTITHCSISNGDDNVTIGSGHGEPSVNISVLHNHFYAGHGMSIGSGTRGGVSHMLVYDLTIDGADNGIRVKSDRSHGGLVHDITYSNICMRNVTNPLAFFPFYADTSGDQLPVFRDIRLADIHILTKGSFTFFGLDAQHKLGVTLDNVYADDLPDSAVQARDVDFAIGDSNLKPEGDDVSLRKLRESRRLEPLQCDGRFVPYPSLPRAPEMAGGAPPVDAHPYVGPGAK